MSSKTNAKISVQIKERALFWCGLIVVFFLTLYALRTILLPFVLGLIIAYLLDPIVRKLERAKISRSIGAFIVILVIIFLFLIGFMFLLPIIHHQTMAFITNVPKYMDESWVKIQNILSNLQDKMSPEQFDSFRQNIASQVNSSFGFASNLVKTVTSNGMAIFSGIALFLITPIISFYLLKDWPKLKHKAASYFPKKHEKTIRQLLSEINKTLSGFLRGQFTVCTILAFYYSIGLSVVGLDVAIPIGILTGYLIFIPYVGWGIGFALSLILGYLQMQSGLSLIPVIGLYSVGLFLEGSILTPNLVGKSVRLHPVWVIFSIFVGGYLMGFWGVFLAVPIAGTIAVLIRYALQQYKDSKLYKE